MCVWQIDTEIIHFSKSRTSVRTLFTPLVKYTNLFQSAERESELEYNQIHFELDLFDRQVRSFYLHACVCVYT